MAMKLTNTTERNVIWRKHGVIAIWLPQGRLLNKRPGQGAQNGIAKTDIPGLRPVQIRIARPVAEDSQRMQSIVCCPLPLERPETPLPHLTIRMLLLDLRQLPLKSILLYFERRFELEIFR